MQVSRTNGNQNKNNMNVQQIKRAVDMGLLVYWKDLNYLVVKNRFGYYLENQISNHRIELTHIDDKGKEVLNCKECQFLIQ